MTRVFVNDREIESPGDLSSVAQVLHHVDGAHLEEGSVIDRVRVNGLPLVLRRAGGATRQEDAGIYDRPSKVEVYTANATDIAQISVSEALGFLDGVEQVIPLWIMGWRDEGPEESFDNLRQLCEGFYWLDVLLDRLEADSEFCLEAAGRQTSTERGYRRELLSTLRRLHESREKGEKLRIAELLEGEILPVLPVLRRMFARTAQRWQ